MCLISKGALIHHINVVCEIFKKDLSKQFFKAGTFRKSIIFFAQVIRHEIYKAHGYLVPEDRIGHIYT